MTYIQAAYKQIHTHEYEIPAPDVAKVMLYQNLLLEMEANTRVNNSECCEWTISLTAKMKARTASRLALKATLILSIRCTSYKYNQFLIGIV